LRIDFGTQPVYCQHGQYFSNYRFALTVRKLHKMKRPAEHAAQAPALRELQGIPAKAKK